jgi:hypothetical protein
VKQDKHVLESGRQGCPHSSLPHNIVLEPQATDKNSTTISKNNMIMYLGNPRVSVFKK